MRATSGKVYLSDVAHRTDDSLGAPQLVGPRPTAHLHDGSTATRDTKETVATMHLIDVSSQEQGYDPAQDMDTAEIRTTTPAIYQSSNDDASSHTASRLHAICIEKDGGKTFHR